jgi:3-isopropylmalate/(R)-2-methylmalate dehydratase small subunit
VTNPPFVSLSGVAIPLGLRNVDTDQIIPARFLRKSRAAGMAAYLFHDLRLDEGGRPRGGFVLDDPKYAGASILVSRENFGSGSSREAAVYALWDRGIRAVVAPSFGDIFFSNALKNGLLPVVLPAPTVERLLASIAAEPLSGLTVDLERQAVVEPSGTCHRFEIDPFQKHLLMTGMTELDYTMALLPQIESFEQGRAAAQPWA